jgi:hypothetical protein
LLGARWKTQDLKKPWWNFNEAHTGFFKILNPVKVANLFKF